MSMLELASVDNASIARNHYSASRMKRSRNHRMLNSNPSPSNDTLPLTLSHVQYGDSAKSTAQVQRKLMQRSGIIWVAAGG
mmetsp:Transcript_9454/g.28599  ORF Transcript_9454/g.28599 Transcript_9454/m.28599 type:complete len:81 (+) Transcript_9454:2073-2315(+)